MRRRGIDYWFGFWTLIFITSTALLAYFTSSSTPRSESFALKASDQQGRLRIDWNPNDALIRNAQGGTLEVNDGGVVNRYPVEPKTLKAGGFDYLRKNPDVLLTLTLFHKGKPGPQASVRSVAAVQSVTPPEQPAEQETRASQRRRGVRSRRR